MLFLLNQDLIDVGDPMEALQHLGLGMRAPPSIAQLVKLGQDAAFAGAGIENAHEGIRRTLSALFCLSGQANCALFLVPPRARAPAEVTYRLAYAPLTTMVFLRSAQDAGKLNAALINEQVWRVAPGERAA
ncbi:MAG: hypothetical protein AB7P07_09565 [Hyphomonadaceae bacterium]